MWTQASWSFRFLSALALLLLLAHLERIVFDQAVPDSADSYIAPEAVKFHIPGFSAAVVKNGHIQKRKTYGVRSSDSPGHEKSIDRLVSVTQILAGRTRMGRGFTGIHGKEAFGVGHADSRRPGFLSGRLVRAIYERFARLEEGREGNWN
jgi:hypothetical protein